MSPKHSPCPCEGQPGQWRQGLQTTAPPSDGYRVIPGSVWWRLVFWQWRRYLMARTIGLSNVIPPFLAPFTAKGVFFTDQESLEGLLNPAEFAWRLSLGSQAHKDCQLYGCAIVRFKIPQPAIIPPPSSGGSQGLTGNGAREWITQKSNIELNDTMEVRYVDVSKGGPRWFNLPL